MKFQGRSLVVVLLVAIMVFTSVSSINSKALTQDPCGSDEICLSQDLLSLNSKINSAEPVMAMPAWRKSIVTFTYSIETRGTITVSSDEFKQQVRETLDDDQGWIRLGVRFVEVDSSSDVVVVLSEASHLPMFSVGCTAYYSCTVGSYVIANQTRWLDATDPWNASGGNLRDYRHMVINHEMGHWLGHPHATCGGADQLAPLMMQQSTSLDECRFNAWPLDSELWSTRL